MDFSVTPGNPGMLPYGIIVTRLTSGSVAGNLRSPGVCPLHWVDDPAASSQARVQDRETCPERDKSIRSRESARYNNVGELLFTSKRVEVQGFKDTRLLS